MSQTDGSCKRDEAQAKDAHHRADDTSDRSQRRGNREIATD
jgi:hypothetical protein